MFGVLYMVKHPTQASFLLMQEKSPMREVWKSNNCLFTHTHLNKTSGASTACKACAITTKTGQQSGLNRDSNLVE